MLVVFALFSALSVLRAASAAPAYNGEATIALFEPATTSTATHLTPHDCGRKKPSAEIKVPINHCLWGDYFLVNNFAITQYPTCSSGRPAIAFFYETTSCTGKPTFRSDEANITNSGELVHRCLFGSSPKQWSMVFRCSSADSQTISSGFFRQAIPPSYETSRHNAPSTSDGVVTPFYAYDCTVRKSRPPTFLESGVCLKLELGHSIYVSQPVVCANNRVALAKIYADEECSSWSGFLGSDAYSAGYYASIDKKCHSTSARSFSFSCGEKENTKFEDLPPYKHKDVIPLVLLEPAPEPEPNPDPEPEPDPQPTDPEPEDPPAGQNAEIVGYGNSGCASGPIVDTLVRKVDTCIRTDQYDSVHIKNSAVCGNGSQALMARYSGTGCRDENMISLTPVLEAHVRQCIPATEIQSLVFWCEGLPERQVVDGGSGSLIKLLLIILLVSIVFIVLAIAGIVLKGKEMLQQANVLLQKIKALYGNDEGGIRL